MKILDFIKVSLGLPFHNNSFSFIGLVISLFLLLMSVNTFHMLYQEKQQPWEISATADKSQIDDKTVAELSKMDGVVMSSPVIEVSTIVQIGDYSSQLTLKGVNSAYVGILREGIMFVDKDILPVIIMNKHAYSTFENDKKKKIPGDTSYTNLKTVLKDEKEYPAKIGGILQDNSNDSVAYISLNAAKTYVLRQGKVPQYSAIQLRLKNVGKAKSIIKTLKSMGLTAKDALPDKQQEWDGRQTEATYIGLSGICILVFVLLYILGRMECDMHKTAKQYRSLLFVGMTQQNLALLFAIRYILMSLLATLCCYCASYIIPMFLNAEFVSVTVFGAPHSWLSLLTLTGVNAVCMSVVYFKMSGHNITNI